MSIHCLRTLWLPLVLVLSAAAAGCAGNSRARDPVAYAPLARASLPQDGVTRAILGAIGAAASEGAVALVLEDVGRKNGYDRTWAQGNRYYDQAAQLVERDLAPMLSRLDPSPLLERNLTRALQRHLSEDEAAALVQMLAQPDGQRFIAYMDAVMAQGLLAGIARRTPVEFRSFFLRRLEALQPRLQAVQAHASLTDEDRAQLSRFAGSPLGRKLGRAYRTWAESLRGEWTADLVPRTREVQDNLLRSADDLREILRAYEQWRGGVLRDARAGSPHRFLHNSSSARSSQISLVL